MHIVFITNEFVSEKLSGGGLASYLNNISRILIRKGHEVTIVTESGIDETIDFQGITVERVKTDELIHGIQFAGKRYLNMSRKLNRRLKSMIRKGKKIDMVQYPNVGALGLFRTKLPSVIRISSDNMCWRRADDPAFDVTRYYGYEDMTDLRDYLEDLTVAMGDAVYGPGIDVAKRIEMRTGVPIEIIESPCLLDADSLTSEEQFTELKGKQYILTYGTLSVMKGVYVIGEAIHDILERNKDIYYVFAGLNADLEIAAERIKAMDYIRRKAGEYAGRVVYLGVVERKKLYSVIKGARVCAFASRIDNFPNTCIEALYFGGIVVGTDGASFEQVISDGEEGFLFTRDDPKSFAGKIQEALMVDESRKSEIRLKAGKRLEALSEEAVYEKLIAVYDRAARRSLRDKSREKRIKGLMFGAMLKKTANRLLLKK